MYKYAEILDDTQDLLGQIRQRIREEQENGYDRFEDPNYLNALRQSWGLPPNPGVVDVSDIEDVANAYYKPIETGHGYYDDLENTEPDSEDYVELDEGEDNEDDDPYFGMQPLSEDWGRNRRLAMIEAGFIPEEWRDNTDSMEAYREAARYVENNYPEAIVMRGGFPTVDRDKLYELTGVDWNSLNPTRDYQPPEYIAAYNQALEDNKGTSFGQLFDATLSLARDPEYLRLRSSDVDELGYNVMNTSDYNFPPYVDPIMRAFINNQALPEEDRLKGTIWTRIPEDEYKEKYWSPFYYTDDNGNERFDYAALEQATLPDRYMAYNRLLYKTPDNVIHYDSPTGPVYTDGNGNTYDPAGYPILNMFDRGAFWNPLGYGAAHTKYAMEHPDTFNLDMFGGWTPEKAPEFEARWAKKIQDSNDGIQRARVDLTPAQRKYYKAQQAYKANPNAETYEAMHGSYDGLTDDDFENVGRYSYQDVLDKHYKGWHNNPELAKQWLDEWNTELGNRTAASQKNGTTFQFGGRPAKWYKPPATWKRWFGAEEPVEYNPYKDPQGNEALPAPRKGAAGAAGSMTSGGASQLR